MVLHCKLAFYAAFVVGASSVVLRGQPSAPKRQATESKGNVSIPVKAALRAHVAETKANASVPAALVDAETLINYGSVKVVPSTRGHAGAAARNVSTDVKSQAATNATKVVKPQDEAATLEGLKKGLETIHNLRALFTAKPNSPKDGSEKFANGALSEELSKKDSQVWSAIESMLGETQKAVNDIKGKDKAVRAQVMKSLEDKLDGKAKDLSNVTADVSKKQQQQDEEYLLGLLLMHKDDWSMEKQLNATEKFMHNSPVLQNLFQHHDPSKALAPQLAALMDAHNKAGVVKVEKRTAELEEAAKKMAKAQTAEIVANAKKKAAAKMQPEVAKKVGDNAPKDTKKKNVAKAATAAAKALFIQLASTITNRDCPYCAAQCVDKCHTAGKPYVQCLTDCADAGKN
jgi:hypothetical protein